MPDSETVLPAFTVSAENERIGINTVRSAFTSMNWLFSERPGPDFGIDGIAEIIVNGQVTGKLIGVQVKCGMSYFTESTKSGWRFRGELKHLNYWRGHTLPVIVVICDPESKKCYWVEVGPDSKIERTENSWSIEIPSTHLLGESSTKALERVAENTTREDRNLGRLRGDTSLMELIDEGRELCVEIEEWVNKTSGRGTFRILDVTDQGLGNDGVEVTSWMLFAGLWDYESLVEALFPWATISLDEYMYDMHEEDEWADECGVYDSEEDRYLFFRETFEEWRSKLPSFRPYTSKGSGEVDVYRLRLELNTLGAAWLEVQQFALVPSPFERE